MKKKYFSILLLIAFELGLLKPTNSIYFELFISNNEIDLYFSQNFETSYLINSFERNKELLSLIDCLSLSSTNSFTEAISYQDLNNSKVICNFYSSCPTFDSDTEISQSIKSRIYIINNCSNSSYPGEIFFNFLKVEMLFK